MNVSREEVAVYLEDVKRAITLGRYQIAIRAKNQELFVDYVLTEESCKDILLDLQVEDFSEAIRNEHPEYAHEILYIFGKNVKLLPRFGDKEEKVSLYIKLNKLEHLYVLVVSFHKQGYPLRYKFQ